jgi:hypothetical protein
MPGGTEKTMMQRASSLFGLAALILALVGPGAGTVVRAQEQNAASQPSDQLAISVNAPGLLDNSDSLDSEPAPTSGLSSPATDEDASSAAPPQQTGSPFAVLQPWSFAGEDTKAGTESAPFVLDLPPESQTFSRDPDSTDSPPAERSTEPRNFRINDRLKVKAQPIGGGLGGRVTLTFSFDTGY